MTSQLMVARIQDMCRDPAVAVAGLEDGLVPENDDFDLGKVRKSEDTREGEQERYLFLYAPSWACL